jgi:hypothetical protein
MKKLFASNKYLPVALALGALTAAGLTPAFAHQAAGYFGGPRPLHYLSDSSKAHLRISSHRSGSHAFASLPVDDPAGRPYPAVDRNVPLYDGTYGGQ